MTSVLHQFDLPIGSGESVGSATIASVSSWIDGMTDSQRCALTANVVFWAWCVIFCILDRWCYYRRDTSFGKWLYSQKIQGEAGLTYCTTDFALAWKILRVTAFNMLVMAPVSSGLAEWGYDTFHGEHRLKTEDDWRAIVEIPKLVMCYVVVSVWFYLTHRMFHLKWFYKTIHKTHHSITSPAAIVSIYAHPIEFIVGNVMGVGLGNCLTNAHPYTSYFWYACALTDTARQHSGYAFVYSSRHDDHHSDYFNYNFGNSTMDAIFGTQAPPRPKTKKV